MFYYECSIFSNTPHYVMLSYLFDAWLVTGERKGWRIGGLRVGWCADEHLNGLAGYFNLFQRMPVLCNINSLWSTERLIGT